MKLSFYLVEEYILAIINQSLSPASVLEDIKEFLEGQKLVDAQVIVDGLMFYGNTNQRFMKLIYKDEEFIDFDFISISRRNLLKIKSCQHFYENQFLLDYSLLNESTRNLLKKGIAV